MLSFRSFFALAAVAGGSALCLAQIQNPEPRVVAQNPIGRLPDAPRAGTVSSTKPSSTKPAPPKVEPIPAVPLDAIRVGLSTAGSALDFYAPNGLIVRDKRQSARAFRVGAGDRVQFVSGAISETREGNQLFRGSISLQSGGKTVGSWQWPTIQILGNEPARVTSNGKSGRWGRPYRGNFEVFPQQAPEPNARKGALALVNVVALEEYLKGVVPWEMSPSAPLEALKAQAICARTKTLSQLDSVRHSGGFTVCDYDHCQGYPGIENEKPASSRAVDETRGLALYAQGKIIDAVFSTNSGGITAAASDVWKSSSETPYLRSVTDFPASSTLKKPTSEAEWARYVSQPWPSLARPNQEARDALAARRKTSARTAALFGPDDWPEFYRWKRFVSLEDANRAFADDLSGRVVGIEVVERTASGRIRRLNVLREPLKPIASSQNLGAFTVVTTLEGDGKIRAMFSKRLGSTTALPSSTFVVSPQTDASGQIIGWQLIGAGWGHGVGMCQRGAQNHALEGWDARRIVNWYYRGVEVHKVSPQQVAALGRAK